MTQNDRHLSDPFVLFVFFYSTEIRNPPAIPGAVHVPRRHQGDTCLVLPHTFVTLAVFTFYDFFLLTFAHTAFPLVVGFRCNYNQPQHSFETALLFPKSTLDRN